MPLARKVLVAVAEDGLVVQPLGQKGQKERQGSGAAVKILWRGRGIVKVGVGAEGPAGDGKGEWSGKGFEAFGIVGLLTVSNTSYLISITRREQVAQIHGAPVYVVADVALTPLSSRKDAEASVKSTKASLVEASQAGVEEEESSESEDDEAILAANNSDEIDDVEEAEDQPPPSELLAKTHKRSGSVVEDVFSKKGGYGRFARSWFSRNGWMVERKRPLLGLSAAGLEADNKDDETPVMPVPVGDDQRAMNKQHQQDMADEAKEREDHVAELLPKLLRTTSLLFGSSRSFYFCYDYDITRSVSNKDASDSSEKPLHQKVDPLFFWNQNVMRPFIDAGYYHLVLPLLQGFVGQQSFLVDRNPTPAVLPNDVEASAVLELKDMVPAQQKQTLDSVNTPPTPKYNDGHCEEPEYLDAPILSLENRQEPHPAIESTKTFLLTIISRRSTERAGLRYLRRGIDNEGHTANSVETEQILSNPDWGSKPIYSFLQVRGSIPIFFSQTPYSFKPVPQIQHSEATNYLAFKKHFENLFARYGNLAADSLVDKHGNEAIVGDAYAKCIDRLNQEGGIDGKKVSFEWFDFHAACKGMHYENVSLLLDTLGDFGYSVEHCDNLEKKQACVLRTNCMDCLDRTNVVQSATGRKALEAQLKVEGFDLSIQIDQTNQWFNTLWADNGDAISKQYASTAAMKGDFTRTRKRDYRGALTDGYISISRFYSGLVNDYFSQAAIDFLLGNATELIFEEFLSNLSTIDPSISMVRTRQNAIEVSRKLVIADSSEELVGGWALLTPHEPHTIKSTPFEESVLLLTNVALYACRFDWNLEKVASFERVDLRHVGGIRFGAYVTSTLSSAQRDEKRNVGLVITYHVGANDITRVNTRSLSTAPADEDAKGKEKGREGGDKDGEGNEQILALKALPARSAAAAEGAEQKLSEEELVQAIAEEIARVAAECGGGVQVVKGNVISLAEAKRSTGLLEQLAWSVKKLVWA